MTVRSYYPRPPLPSSRFEAMVEDQHATVAKRLERRHVAAIETSPDGRSVAACKQLQLGVRAGPQARVGFHERRTAVDVEEHHRLTGPQYRICTPPQPFRGHALLRATVTAPIGQCRHCRACASNVNTRTRPVPPNTRIAICGPR